MTTTPLYFIAARRRQRRDHLQNALLKRAEHNKMARINGMATFVQVRGDSVGLATALHPYANCGKSG
jgi:hypothetical protein